MCCSSKDRAELDLYFQLTGEPSEPRPGYANEDRLRKEGVLRRRSPLAHQALLLARDTLRHLKPADTLVLLPKTAAACLALLDALDASPELTLEIREFNVWDRLWPKHCAAGGAFGGIGASGGSSQSMPAEGGAGGCFIGPSDALYAGGVSTSGTGVGGGLAGTCSLGLSEFISALEAMSKSDV